MNQKDLGITDKNLYLQLLEQVKNGKIGFFSNYIKEEEANQVTRLQFSNVEIENLEFLKFFPNLDKLSLDTIKSIKNINGISYLTKLTDLNIYETEIDDLTPIVNCSTIQILDYIFEERKNVDRYDDFYFLSNLSELVLLDLSGNNLQDITFVDKLTKLQDIVVSNCPISDTKSLSKLTQLKYIEAEGCELTDLVGITPIPTLRTLLVKNNRFSEDKMTELKHKFADIECFEI